jgi:hypothetical protein
MCVLNKNRALGDAQKHSNLNKLCRRPEENKYKAGFTSPFQFATVAVLKNADKKGSWTRRYSTYCSLKYFVAKQRARTLSVSRTLHLGMKCRREHLNVTDGTWTEHRHRKRSSVGRIWNSQNSHIFWDITTSSPSEANRRFGGKCRFHLQDQSTSQARS